jgi:hypothetical protein
LKLQAPSMDLRFPFMDNFFSILADGRHEVTTRQDMLPGKISQ